MLRWLAWYLRLNDRYAADKRAARLTEEEALAIAQAASTGRDAYSLRFAAIEKEGEERLWIFATTSRGGHFLVKIRDRDGHVVSRGRVGFR
jgi:hypothetical protein